MTIGRKRIIKNAGTWRVILMVGFAIGSAILWVL